MKAHGYVTPCTNDLPYQKMLLPIFVRIDPYRLHFSSSNLGADVGGHRDHVDLLGADGLHFPC